MHTAGAPTEAEKEGCGALGALLLGATVAISSSNNDTLCV